MKRRPLIALISLLPISVMAQVNFPIDSTTKKITYTSVLNAEGSKKQLYNKALAWIAKEFASSNDVIQVKNEDEGSVLGKFNIPIDGRSGNVNVNFSIYLKDNKYKYIFTDLYYGGTSEFSPWPLESSPSAFKVNMMKYSQNKIKAQANQTILNLIDGLNAFMAKKPDNDF